MQAKSQKRVYRKRKYSKASPYERRMELLAKKPASTILGRIAGRIDPRYTTLAKSISPFTGVKYVTFVYENGLTAMANNATYVSANIVCNGAYDVDNNVGAYFGNKQPLYFDTLMSASGPYKQYKVISWETKYTLISQSTVPCNVYFIPPISAGSEIDSVAEAENFPGVTKRYLTAKDGSNNKCTVTVKGHIDDVYPCQFDGLNGTISQNPSLSIIGGLLVASADGTTNVTAYVSIEHKMYTELQVVDALVS